jgi:hypothetical protein
MTGGDPATREARGSQFGTPGTDSDDEDMHVSDEDDRASSPAGGCGRRDDDEQPSVTGALLCRPGPGRYLNPPDTVPDVTVGHM